jgi:hypothetical protein
MFDSSGMRLGSGCGDLEVVAGDLGAVEGNWRAVERELVVQPS